MKDGEIPITDSDIDIDSAIRDLSRRLRQIRDQAEAQAPHHRQVMEQLNTAEHERRELRRNILTEERDFDGEVES
jgi:phage shock protein A